MQTIFSHLKAMTTQSLRESFGLRFSMMARRWRRAIDGHLAVMGLTDATWRPLVHLKESGGGISQKDLAARIGVDTSSLVRVLDILEREGLIERRRDQEDGRTNLITLTEAGHAREQAVRRVLHDAERIALERLSDADLEALAASLDLLHHGLSDLERASEQAPASPRLRRRGEAA